MMSRRVRQFAVMLVIVSFVLLAAHSHLFDEKPSEQGSCPYCQWLHNLSHGESPSAALVIVQIVGDALPLPACVLFDKLPRAPFSARSPPLA
jgi:hypothetical protein